MGAPIIENWSAIEGEIRSIAESESIAGFSELEMLVSKVEDVDDFPNLMREAVGSLIRVYFPSEIVSEYQLAPGDCVSCRVRKAPMARHFVHREFISVP